MKKNVLLITMLICFAFAGFAFAKTNPPPMGRMGDCPRADMMRGQMNNQMSPYASMTDAEKKIFDEIHNKYYKDSETLMTQKKIESLKLEAMILDDKVANTDIIQQAKKVSSLHSQIFEKNVLMRKELSKAGFKKGRHFKNQRNFTDCPRFNQRNAPRGQNNN